MLAIEATFPNAGNAPMNRTTRDTVIGLLTGAVGVALSIWLLYLLDLDAAIVELLRAVDGAGVLGILAFALLIAVLVPLLAPTVLLTLGAGALYGVFGGTLLIITAETLGSLAAFWLGRRLLSRPASSWLSRHPRVAAPIAALGRNDWQSVALLRMIPFFPFKVSNYALGLTPLSARAMCLGTWLGLLPIALFNTRLGALAVDVLALAEQRPGVAAQGLVWNLIALVFTALVCIVAARRAATIMHRSKEPVSKVAS